MPLALNINAEIATWHETVIFPKLQAFPTFPRFALHHFALNKRPTLVWFLSPKEIQGRLLLLAKKVKSKTSIQCWFRIEPFQRQRNPERRQRPPNFLPQTDAQPPGTKLPGLELCLWVPVLYLELFCALVGKMCPRISKKSKVILGFEKAQEFFHTN